MFSIPYQINNTSFLPKKKNNTSFEKVMCELRASISVIPKSIYELLTLFF